MKETEELELKKSLTQLKEGVISLSAMLNKHKHGIVIFGISDDGKVCGLSLGSKTKADITGEIRNHLKPLPARLEIDDYTENGKTLVKVLAEGDDTPYSAYGRYYIRVNDADLAMDAYQLQKFFENKDDTYSKWEEAETKYGVEDADEDQLLDLIRTANEKGRMDYVYRNAKEALQKLGFLTDNGKLNNAGWMLLGRGKPLTIKEAAYPTDSRTDFGEIKDFRGNILECLREVISYIQNRINYKAQIVGVQREEIPEIPVRALREIVINSFAHCSYAQKGDFNQYVIFRSKISIYNPGAVIRGIDPKRFASGQEGRKIRNVLIASALYKYGCIDAFGTGFDRTFKLCAQAGVKYQYHEDEFGFTFIFKRDPQFLENLGNAQPAKARKSLDKDLLALIAENKYMTIPEMAQQTGKSVPTVHRHLESMAKEQLLTRVGSRKSGYWQILSKQL